MYGRVGQTGPNGFFFNPASCVAAPTVVSAEAWDGQRASGSATYTPTNCAGVPFAPRVDFGPQPVAAATPTPLSVKVSQRSTSRARRWAPRSATRRSPARGRAAQRCRELRRRCRTARRAVRRHAPRASELPAGSKVGTVAFDSPLVGVVPGSVYLAQPASGPNDLVRLFVVAQAGTQADALRVKFSIRVEVDPATGRLVNTMENLPDQPVNSFTLTFRAGDAPTIRQSRTCGSLSGSAAITPTRARERSPRPAATWSTVPARRPAGSGRRCGWRPRPRRPARRRAAPPRSPCRSATSPSASCAPRCPGHAGEGRRDPAMLTRAGPQRALPAELERGPRGGPRWPGESSRGVRRHGVAHGCPDARQHRRDSSCTCR